MRRPGQAGPDRSRRLLAATAVGAAGLLAVALSGGAAAATDHASYTGSAVYNVTGSMTANDVTVTGAGSGGLNNPGGYSINRGAGNSGW